jgi:ferredoxin
MTGYCGTCRVHFTTLEEWADHQHPERGTVSFGTVADFRKHVRAAS